MDAGRFGDLTKTLAAGASRRRLLKRLGGGLGAVALDGLGRREMEAAPGGNSACAHFCNAVFGEGTPAQSQCASDGAHHRGLCFAPCGPDGAGD